MQENNRSYDDILDLPHHVSKRHSQMSIADRAAQFAPFAALTGYESVIRETTQLVKEQVEQEIEHDEIMDI